MDLLLAILAEGYPIAVQTNHQTQIGRCYYVWLILDGSFGELDLLKVKIIRITYCTLALFPKQQLAKNIFVVADLVFLEENLVKFQSFGSNFSSSCFDDRW